MPEERNNPAPVADRAAWDAAREGVPRELQAARLIVSRKIGGIPFRPYLMGDCDHAPVVKAVAEFADKVYTLLDHLDTNHSDAGHIPGFGDSVDAVRAAMEELQLP